jgi:hypothetical protein
VVVTEVISIDWTGLVLGFWGDGEQNRRTFAGSSSALPFFWQGLE